MPDPIKAAFMMLRSPQGRVLLLRRSEGENTGGTWAFPGGKCKAGETVEQAVCREVLEETGFHAGHCGRWHCRRVADGVDATTFVFDTDEFTPKLNREHSAFLWVAPEDALSMSGVNDV